MDEWLPQGITPGQSPKWRFKPLAQVGLWGLIWVQGQTLILPRYALFLHKFSVLNFL